MNKSTSSILLALLCPLLFAGCGTPEVTDAVDRPALKGGDAIAVFVLRTTNSFKGFQVNADGMTVEGGPSNKEQFFTFFKPEQKQKNVFAVYVVSLRLQPGTYTIPEIDVDSEVPSVGLGTGKIPINESFTVQPGHYYYLGRINADLREAKPNEVYAGGLGGGGIQGWMGVVVAKVTGYASGTFDVNIEDHFPEDISLVTSNYPATANLPFEKDILPPWQRPQR